MRNLITPIILIVIAGAIFFGFIDSQYAEVKEISAEMEEYDTALRQVRDLRQAEQNILAKRASFEEVDIERLEKLLPDNVDNVRLLLDLDAIASKYGMTLRGVSVSQPSSLGQNEAEDAGGAGVRFVTVSFAVNSSYRNFLLFLEDLERSLRLVDVDGVSFQSSDVDFYEYQVSLKTYWLE